jgi:hypothetical protein
MIIFDNRLICCVDRYLYAIVHTVYMFNIIYCYCTASYREVVAVDARNKEIRLPKGEQSHVESVTVAVLEVFFADPQKRWRIAMLNEVGQTAIIQQEQESQQ